MPSILGAALAFAVTMVLGFALLDVDLAILGAPASIFDAYEAQVRAEYAAVPETDFRKGRRNILEGFLARNPIFHTPYFTALCELQARANLKRSIHRLQE